MTTIQLNNEQCSLLKFPVGCPIWYNFPLFRNNDIAEAEENALSTSSFVVKRGVIQGALLRGNTLFYEVAYIDKNGKSIVEEVEDGKFGFGTSCPVTILPVAADADACRDDDSLGLEGEIVLCTPSATDRNSFIYTAMVFLDGVSNVRYEGGIAEKRVVYRRVDDDSIVDKNSGRNAAAGTKSDDADATSRQQSAANTTKNSGKASARQGGCGTCESGDVIGEMPMEGATAAARNHFARHVRGSFEEGEVSEEMPMKAARATNHVVPSSIITDAIVPGSTNVSLSATDSFGSTNINSNVSVAESSLAPSRTKKPRIYLSECDISKSMKASDANQIKIAVPLWLQKDCQSQRKLFFHLLGSSGCITKRIEYNTRCKVYIKVNLGEKGGDPTIKGPMTIHVEAMNTSSTALADLSMARQMIQSLLLQFVGNDGSRGRLLCEVAQSCRGPHRCNESTSNAIKDIHPFHVSIDRGGGQESFMSVVYLPPNFTKASHLLSKETLQKINAADANIRVVATEFKIPTKLCDPYVFVCGKSYQSVDRAVGIVQEVIRKKGREGKMCIVIALGRSKRDKAREAGISW